MVRFFYTLCFIAITSGNVLAETQNPLLFESDSVMELTLPVNFDTLCRPSESPDCDYTPTVLIYRDAAGQEASVSVSIRRRDGWRALQTNCQIPTLFVRFSEQDTGGTPFEGQTLLALNSHCGKGISPEHKRSPRLPDDFEHYVINEYLGYRLYNLVTQVSLRPHLARIRYTNPDDPRTDFTHDAFFVEHFESLAKRLNAELLPEDSFDAVRLDRDAADQMALFQYMIGNTDWSIVNQDNVILLLFPDGRQVPVLYDLDMSGLVNTHYAVPAPDLPISSVEQRYYMGFCHPDTDWDALFTRFATVQSADMALLAEIPGMGAGDRRIAGTYLDSFFKTLNSQEARERMIVNACQPWPEVNNSPTQLNQ
jgi:hypothetical protein